MLICLTSYLTDPPTNVQRKLEAPYSDFGEIFDGLLVLRRLPALVGDHAFRRWSPCGQPGAASRFFCRGKLRFALLACHHSFTTFVILSEAARSFLPGNRAFTISVRDAKSKNPSWVWPND
jgi:hypothetical protein